MEKRELLLEALEAVFPVLEFYGHIVVLNKAGLGVVMDFYAFF